MRFHSTKKGEKEYVISTDHISEIKGFNKELFSDNFSVTSVYCKEAQGTWETLKIFLNSDEALVYLNTILQDENA